jgi:predicted permease
MAVFLALVGKLLPLYLFIVAGYLLGVFLHLKRRPVALLLLYILSPLVIFEGSWTAPLSRGTLALPLLFLVICSVLCVFFYWVSGCIWRRGDTMRNLAAFASANGNTGYFGIPVALALFPPERLGIVVLSSLGFVLYECSTGFFVLARGNFTLRESVRKILALPLMYAFVLGIVVNASHVPVPELVGVVFRNVRSIYSVLGMLLIGVSLAGERLSAIDAKLLTFTTVAKLVIWPTLMLLLIALDQYVFHVFGKDVHDVMLLMGIVPLAVNTVVYSSVLKVHPEKAAVAVMVSTVLALFFIPAVSAVFL